MSDDTKTNEETKTEETNGEELNIFEDDYYDENDLTFMYDADTRGHVDYSNLRDSFIPTTHHCEEKTPGFISTKHLESFCKKHDFDVEPTLLHRIGNKINLKVIDLLTTSLIAYDERNGKVLRPSDVKQAIYLLNNETIID